MVRHLTRFAHSLHSYLLSPCYLPGTFLGGGVLTVNKIQNSLPSCILYSSEGGGGGRARKIEKKQIKLVKL